MPRSSFTPIHRHSHSKIFSPVTIIIKRSSHSVESTHMQASLMRPRGRASLLYRPWAPAESLRATPALLRNTTAPVQLISSIQLSNPSHRINLYSYSSKRHYSRDPLQAELEANTVRGNRVARSRKEEQARQQEESRQKAEEGSYKRKFSGDGRLLMDQSR